MMPTVFEQLLSCSGCNSAVLINDPSASHSTAEQDCSVGIVIRHQAREVLGGVSWLDIFPFTAKHPLSSSPHADAEPENICREFICMEDCATPEGRREISREWGLQWWGFEQHFETIAAWTGGRLGDCPCECHHHKRHAEDPKCEDAGCVDGESAFEGDDCGSVITTAPLVGGQESGRCPVKPRVQFARHVDEFPPGWPEDGRDRSRSEEVRHTDLFILQWREHCIREQNRRDTIH